jgi:hypothetical protein
VSLDGILEKELEVFSIFQDIAVEKMPHFCLCLLPGLFPPLLRWHDHRVVLHMLTLDFHSHGKLVIAFGLILYWVVLGFHFF